MNSLPRVGVTMGDPAGIGPELCLRLLRDERVLQVCTPVVIGDAGVLTRVAQQLTWPEPPIVLVNVERVDFEGLPSGLPYVLDLKAIDADAVEPGKVSATCGRAAYEYVTFAIDEALAGRLDAFATAP